MRRVVEIDPNFAMAYANLALTYSGLGESVLAAESATKAFQLRERASERERFFITFNYDREVTGNLEHAFQTLELWEQTYPRRSAPPDAMELLGGLSTKGTGRWEIAVDRARKTIAAYPDVLIGYGNLALSSFFLDRFGEAENALQQAAAHKKEWLELPQFLVYRYNIAFMKGDNEQMDRVVALAKGKRLAEHWVTNSQALVQARSGHAQLARRLSSRAVDLALQEGRAWSGGDLSVRSGGMGRPLRERQRGEGESHRGPRGDQRPGRRIRLGSCAGPRGRFLSI